MKYTLYKPNSKNTGAVFTFDSVNDKQGKPVLFISMIQQYSWNENTKNGSFKENAKNPEKSATIKLTDGEAGEILSSLSSRIPFVAFHRKEDSTTIIKFSPWDKDRKIKERQEEQVYKTPAWGLSVSKNSAQTFKLPIEAGEAEVIRILLSDYIQRCLTNANQQFQDKYSSNNNKQEKSQAPAKSSMKDAIDIDEDVPF